MVTNHFDYIIVGNGLAGFQLALALSNDPYFKNKQIAIIDKNPKTTNDKTWCYWEKGVGKWDHLITKSWKTAHFFSSNKALKLHLEPYTYKMLESIHFYNDARRVLSKNENIHSILEAVISVEEQSKITVITSEANYTATHVFDSRITTDFKAQKDSYISIAQHFKGWTIETETAVFDTKAFTMMDYRIKHNNQTTFTYVLPITPKKALIEFTYFTPELVADNVYDIFLKRYISEILNINNYTVTEVEKGIIPMTNFPFKSYSTSNVTKIGTAGGWVKGSTGYSFKHTEKKVHQIIENLKANRLPSAHLFQEKYGFYDKVFLKVLQDNNEMGEWIFEQFYAKNPVQTMFQFLDEESSFKEEFKVMKSLFSIAFIKAFFKTL
ncbi:lycopene cyclase [Bizionia saleffrena]|uniref:Lycopene cyclase n=1 Tax=Bizionia saleffrena TaxID=291189 RepID=A0A8H2LF02_9FLAO|nr:lycopene cyclase family protein [Bizionia saleffrena]TYB80095.1 lycopene cyclase [Bizionia saleffrena]